MNLLHRYVFWILLKSCFVLPGVCFLLPSSDVFSPVLSYSMLYKAFVGGPTPCQLRASWICLIRLPHLPSKFMDQQCRGDFQTHRTFLYVMAMALFIYYNLGLAIPSSTSFCNDHFIVAVVTDCALFNAIPPSSSFTIFISLSLSCCLVYSYHTTVITRNFHFIVPVLLLPCLKLSNHHHYEQLLFHCRWPCWYYLVQSYGTESLTFYTIIVIVFFEQNLCLKLKSLLVRLV
mgnify:CR=1 FL=1